jgi:hypothetical protein
MEEVGGYGTGRIHEIIEFLLNKFSCNSIEDLPAKIKLDALCDNLKFSYAEFDELILNNSPVLRTVKGHVFENFFDNLIRKAGYEVIEVGGDSAVDRKVNGFSLQLKTPTLAGTRHNLVQFKTHKTHGAKSERECFSYYHSKNHFADLLVGLVTYSPLIILFIFREELPSHPLSPEHILSPFTVDWTNHLGKNSFERIGVKLELEKHPPLMCENELLPNLAGFLNVTSDIILNTILNKDNFRIWDMAIRGFSREIAFKQFCKSIDIDLLSPYITGRKRADKSDHAILNKDKESYTFLQMKGISTNNCSFTENNLIVATETQLTRGRVNDHPTQSRLYLSSDFDFLILALDPAISYLYQKAAKYKNPSLEWEFYAIPTSHLESHHQMPHRIKSLQKFKYKELQRYKASSNFITFHNY